MMYRKISVKFILIILLITGCNTIKPYYGRDYRDWQTKDLPSKAAIKHIVYLMGDGGEKESNPLFEVVPRLLKEHPDSLSTVIWLGDNIYYDGLPEPDESDRKEKEEVIMRQMKLTDSTFQGRTIFVPGNHDWNESSVGGLAAVNRQEEFIETYFNDRDVFMPSNGCAGPVEVHVNDQLLIIAVDTEWWSHKFTKRRAPDADCTVEDKLDLLIQLEDVIRTNRHKNIMIIGHHPLMSNSNHGGHYNFLDHLFPLRLVRDNLYIPLPLIGSLYPLLRKLGVSAQDIPSPEGQQWKNAIFSMTEHMPNVIYAAGHDHNLQLHRHMQMHQILSGSAAKTTFAAKGFDAAYVQQRVGFARILYYEDGQVWVEYYITDEKHPEGKLSLRTPLYSWKSEEREPYNLENVPDYRDSIKTIVANDNYEISDFAELFLGEHYRDEWLTPVTVPYLDVKSFSGGLDPIKKGGGKQTLSLRLINEDSVQFVLRSINKFPAKAIPAKFRNTWINDLVQDQISTAHPYGAFTIPIMADALDIFYTRPKLVYTPNTPYLEQYMNQFGGMLGMIEIRPDEDLSEYARFGNSENVVSSETMFRHLRDDNDNEVDQRLYLKSRLFDMLIGDWDRHEDQWRWAEFKKPDKGSVFKPIPRDRDQAYSRYDGLIPWLLSRKWAFRNFVDFEDKINDVKGLTMVAKNIDRMLLNQLSREDWRRIALQIKVQLSDYVIESAVRQMPPEVFPISGEKIIVKLKSRRDNIIETAMEYYDILAEEVYVVTSNKHEKFEIEKIDKDSTRISVYKTKKEGDVDRLLFERVFLTKETDELRIFGRGGNDQYLLKGDVKNNLRLKIVGGEGEDMFTTNSSAPGFGNNIWIYDNEVGNIFDVNPNVKLKLSEEVWVNEFSRNNLYQLDYTGPRFDLQTNIDDGLLLGLGVQIRRHGFKSEPFKFTHFLMGYHAFRTNAFRFVYNGSIYNLFGNTYDLEINGDYKGPNYVINYFGYGNLSTYDKSRDISYYQIKMDVLLAETLVRHRFSPVWSLGLGPHYSHYNLHEAANSFIGNEVVQDEFHSTSITQFAGVKFYSMIDLKDLSVDPEKGLKWYVEYKYNNEVSGNGKSFSSLSSDLSFNFTPNLPFRLTFAQRIGAGKNFGDFYFYQSKFLDGTENLRGYRRTRFAGRSNFYSNTEMRLKIFQFSSNLLTGDFGGIGFFDIGHVSTKSQSGIWHHSFGPGAYLNFYNMFVVSGTYAISEEEKLFNFRLGFLF